MGLNAYEARSYLVLLGHPRFKALELAARAHVPRQKIYEVLDSLMEKGFASVIQDRTKVFSAIAPDQALPAYLDRRNKALEQQIAEQGKAAAEIVAELMATYAEGRDGTGALEIVQIVNDPVQTAVRVQKILRGAAADCMAVLWTAQMADALLEAHARGVRCRALAEKGAVDSALMRRCKDAGVEVREAMRVPVKVVVSDGRGVLVLADPVSTQPQRTAFFFEHAGMAEAMKIVFEEFWRGAS
jgi:sugar-specific transcriptional regulator TrmB